MRAQMTGPLLSVMVVVLSGCAVSIGHASGGPGMMNGAQGSWSSSAPCAVPALPGVTVEAVLVDMGMSHMMGGTAPIGAHMMLRAEPRVLPAGEVSLVARNRGWRTHELVVLPLPAGSVAGQRVPGPDGTVDEAGALGEASAPCAEGTGDGIPSGGTAWTTTTLPPGHYELVCNLPNHYADGMYAELVVR